VNKIEYIIVNVCHDSNSVKLLGGLSCFSPTSLQIMASKTMSLYANGTTTIPVSRISSVGTVVGTPDC
jgi:hypothetical protein